MSSKSKWTKVGSFFDPFVTANVVKNVNKEKEEQAAQKSAMNAALAANESSVTTEKAKLSVDTATKEAALAEEEKMKRRKGYKSTILTGPEGLTTAPSTLKTTLG